MRDEFRPGITLTLLYGRASSPHTMVKLLKALRADPPDVVLAMSTLACLMAAVARMLGVARHVVLLEVNYPAKQFETMAPWRRWVTKLTTPPLYRRADVVAGNSDEIVAYMKQWIGPGPLYRRDYNPVDFPHLHGLAAETLSLPPRQIGELVILGAGRMWRQKGFDVLLHACARLLDHPVPWKLWMLGEGGELENLKALGAELGLGDRVVWLGMQRNPFPYFKVADVVVLPSRFEGFPNVLLEAMALGRASVATDCLSGPRELADGQRCGLLVPVEDDAAMAAAIGQLLESPERRAELGANARARTERIYSDRQVFEVFIETLNLAMAGAS